MLPSPQASSALVTSDDVISDRLVSFHDIQVSLITDVASIHSALMPCEARNCACEWCNQYTLPVPQLFSALTTVVAEH